MNLKRDNFTTKLNFTIMEILRPFKKVDTAIKINSPLNKVFINAFCHRDFDIIETHLSKNGRFYGFSKPVFILKLKAALNRFDKRNKNVFEIKLL